MSAALDLLVACSYQERRVGLATNQNDIIPVDKAPRERIISIAVLRFKRAAARLKATQGHLWFVASSPILNGYLKRRYQYRSIYCPMCSACEPEAYFIQGTSYQVVGK